ncbi:MAG: hypothetical protein NXI24_06640 [bacterium]|nr:hypothetical protein [bacterium]
MQAPQTWKIISNAAGDRNLRLWNLLNQASEIIDEIEVTLRANRDQARQSALAAADATSPQSLRLINLVRDMHTNALQDDGVRQPANRILESEDLASEFENGFGDNILPFRADLSN